MLIPSWIIIKLLLLVNNDYNPPHSGDRVLDVFVFRWFSKYQNKVPDIRCAFEIFQTKLNISVSSFNYFLVVFFFVWLMWLYFPIKVNLLQHSTFIVFIALQRFIIAILTWKPYLQKWPNTRWSMVNSKIVWYSTEWTWKKIQSTFS